MVLDGAGVQCLDLEASIVNPHCSAPRRGFTRAKRPQRVPAVLTQTEVATVLGRMTGVLALMASLLYGAGLRLLECARMRAKDVDFEQIEIVVHDGKGRKDRITMLPERMVDPLRAHLAGVREQHARDVAAGAGWVELPDALDRKYPNAAREWPWQWIFRATRTYVDPATSPDHWSHLGLLVEGLQRRRDGDHLC